MLITIFIIFIFGLIFGSFLNVLIYRLPLDQDVIRGRSHCPKCGKTLRFSELIPVLSFFLLKGKCLGCKAKISWQYPSIEFISGLLWILIFYKVFGNFVFGSWDLFRISDFGFLTLDFIYQIFIFSSLLAVTAIDAKLMIIPDKIIYPAAVISLIYILGQALRFGSFNIFIQPVLAAIFSFLFFFFIFFISKGRAMGFGDAKLSFLIGLFLGLPQILVGLLWSFVVGALFGIMLIALGHKKFSSQIAFGPFLAFGTLIAYMMPLETFLGFIENLLIKFY